MAKDLEKIINEAKQLVDTILGEAEQNEIPEVPENKKTAGKNVKKEIEGKSDGNSDAVLSKGKPIGEHDTIDEHVDNVMPEVPDQSKTSGKDIKKAVASATNPKIGKPVKNKQPSIDNELPDGVTPDPVQTSAKKMKKDIAEAIQNVLSKKKVVKESGDLTLNDMKDYLEDLKKKGFTDKKKLLGMLKKAKEIAAKQGKSGDKKTVFGIFQSFFKAV